MKKTISLFRPGEYYKQKENERNKNEEAQHKKLPKANTRYQYDDDDDDNNNLNGNNSYSTPFDNDNLDFEKNSKISKNQNLIFESPKKNENYKILINGQSQKIIHLNSP